MVKFIAYSASVLSVMLSLYKKYEKITERLKNQVYVLE